MPREHLKEIRFHYGPERLLGGGRFATSNGWAPARLEQGAKARLKPLSPSLATVAECLPQPSLRRPGQSLFVRREREPRAPSWLIQATPTLARRARLAGCTGHGDTSAQALAAKVSPRAIGSAMHQPHARAQQRGRRIPAEQVLVASTGRIGVSMPMDNVKRGILAAADLLGNTPEHAAQVAEAIMTSDTRAKQIAVEFMLDGTAVRIGGICKGAGMIQPGMSPVGTRPASRPLHATMLCFMTTDAALERPTLQAALTEAVANSFNRITIDGDMSTNDTVLLLANGLAGNARLAGAAVRKPNSIADCGLRIADFENSAPGGRFARNLAVFQTALNHVCLELAQMILRYGEGVSRFVTVRVSGARTFTEADAAVRAVANSAGQDKLVRRRSGWGRILDALGYS